MCSLSAHWINVDNFPGRAVTSHTADTTPGVLSSDVRYCAQHSWVGGFCWLSYQVAAAEQNNWTADPFHELFVTKVVRDRCQTPRLSLANYWINLWISDHYLPFWTLHPVRSFSWTLTVLSGGTRETIFSRLTLWEMGRERFVNCEQQNIYPGSANFVSQRAARVLIAGGCYRGEFARCFDIPAG